MLAYKKLTFEYYPLIREGNFLGKIINPNSQDNTYEYELKLPTDIMFSKVHGEMFVYYLVDENNKNIIFKTITPEAILDEGNQLELATYKGVMVSKSHSEKDMFKINLLNMIKNN